MQHKVCVCMHAWESVMGIGIGCDCIVLNNTVFFFQISLVFNINLIGSLDVIRTQVFLREQLKLEKF